MKKLVLILAFFVSSAAFASDYEYLANAVMVSESDELVMYETVAARGSWTCFYHGGYTKKTYSGTGSSRRSADMAAFARCYVEPMNYFFYFGCHYVKCVKN